MRTLSGSVKPCGEKPAGAVTLSIASDLEERWVQFDLRRGPAAALAPRSAGVVEATITDEGNGWKRVLAVFCTTPEPVARLLGHEPRPNISASRTP